MSTFPPSYGMNQTPVNNDFGWNEVDAMYAHGTSNVPNDVSISHTNNQAGPTAQDTDDVESGEALIVNHLDALTGSVRELHQFVRDKMSNEILEKLRKWEYHLGKHIVAMNNQSKNTDTLFRALMHRHETQVLKKIEELESKMLMELEQKMKDITTGYLHKEEFHQLLYGSDIPDASMRAGAQ